MASLREDIVRAMHLILDSQLREPDIVTVEALGRTARARFDEGNLEPHTDYTSIEHYKAIAASVLRKWQPDDAASEAYDEQGELFAGRLQERYPRAHKRGEEPAYIRREVMSDDDIDWNVAQLEKSGHARLEHADALRAWKRDRHDETLPAANNC